MAKLKEGTNIPVQNRGVSHRSRLLPFGIGGTLLLAGGLTLVNPLLGALVAATPLTYLAIDKVLRPAWHSLTQSVSSYTSNLFRPRRSVPSGSYGNLKVSDGSKTGNTMVDALVDRLRANGLQVSTDWKAAQQVLQSLPEKYDVLKKPDAKVYGFVFQGTVFLNPRDTGPDVPIHEYTHVWAEALRQNNHDEWESIVGMMKRETALWNEVQQNYPHLETDDEIADEVLATYSGRHGAERLVEHCQHGETPEQVFKNLLGALERFWKRVAKFFNVHYTNKEDLADRVLADFLKGVNPNKHIDENKITMNDRTPLASQGHQVLSPQPDNNQSQNEDIETTAINPKERSVTLNTPYEGVRISIYGDNQKGYGAHLSGNYTSVPYKLSGVDEATFVRLYDSKVDITSFSKEVVEKYFGKELREWKENKAFEQYALSLFKNLPQDVPVAFSDKFLGKYEAYEIDKDPAYFALYETMDAAAERLDPVFFDDLSANEKYELFSTLEKDMGISKKGSPVRLPSISKLQQVVSDIHTLVDDHVHLQLGCEPTDVDVFLQNPIPVGRETTIAGVSVNFNGLRDDAVILQLPAGNDHALQYDPYSFPFDDGDRQGVYEVIDSHQAAAALRELEYMKQRHTLQPISILYASGTNQCIAAIPLEAHLGNDLTARLQVNTAVAKVTANQPPVIVPVKGVYSGDVDARRDYNLALQDVAKTLMARHTVVKENTAYVVTLEPNSKANLDKGEEPLHDLSGDCIKALELIARSYDPSVNIQFNGQDVVVKVCFGNMQSANQFVNGYFEREDIAKDAVHARTNNNNWTMPHSNAYIQAYLVEHAGIDKFRRETAANALYNLSRADSLDVSETVKDDVRGELRDMANDIPAVTYRYEEARQVYEDIMKGAVSTDIADYYPVSMGATGYFLSTLGNQQQVFSAFDNSNGDMNVDDFTTELGAVMYCKGTMSADDIHRLEQPEAVQSATVADSPLQSSVLFTDDIILYKDDLPKYLSKGLPFDENGELSVRMAFHDGYAEELPEREGQPLQDADRLKLTYPTMAEIDQSPKKQDKIEFYTGREWQYSEPAEKVYDAALVYGKASRLYKIRQTVDPNNAEVEHLAQDALYNRITDIGARAFSGKQKQALLNFKQTCGEADRATLADRLMSGIRERLASSGTPASWADDGHKELTDLFNGIERDTSCGFHR